MYHKSVAVRLAYGSMSLFIAILHNVFLLYYVDIFVSVYKIDRNSFWLGEVGVFVFVSKYLFLLSHKNNVLLLGYQIGNTKQDLDLLIVRT